MKNECDCPLDLMERLVRAVDNLFSCSIGKATLFEPEGGALWEAREQLEPYFKRPEKPQVKRSVPDGYWDSREGDPYP